MKTASVTEVAAQFKDFLAASQEQPVLVTRNGKAVAVLMAVCNKAQAEQLAASSPRSLRSVLQEAHEEIEQTGGIPHKEFWEQVAQSRAARRKRKSG